MEKFGKLEALDDLPESGSGEDVDDRIIWVDLEMSGLEVAKERIIEIAVTVTDGKLTKAAQGPNLIINQSKELMDAMDPWCIKHHGESGLTESVLTSKVSESEAEQAVLDFIRKYTKKEKCPLAGNTIYMDKLFLLKYMPKLCEHLHYRLIDVSTFKELCRRWMREAWDNAPPKKFSHRAADDIFESIEELQYYRRCMLVPH